MTVPQIVQQIKAFFQTNLGKAPKVIGVRKTENGWLATVEIIEESEYMRNRALDDIIGLYEVELDQAMHVIGYQRISLRERDKFENTEDDD